MREASNIWPKASPEDVFQQHEKDDVFNKDLSIEERPQFHLLPNSTHYIIIN
jgi:hypothetical protein